MQLKNTTKKKKNTNCLVVVSAGVTRLTHFEMEWKIVCVLELNTNTIIVCGRTYGMEKSAT